MIRDEHTGWSEAEITINGKLLSFAESMTMRVAITSFAMSVADSKNLGDLGSIAHGYHACCVSIFEKMMEDKK